MLRVAYDLERQTMREARSYVQVKEGRFNSGTLRSYNVDGGLKLAQTRRSSHGIEANFELGP